MIFQNPDRKPTICHPIGHPVDVIASFKLDGKLIPQYFRVEDDRSEIFTFQLSGINSTKDRQGVMIFHCNYHAYGRLNTVILNFDVTKCLWLLG